MADNASDFLEAALLGHVLNGIVFAAPSSIWLGLSTTAPNEDGTGITEPVPGYARLQLTAAFTVLGGGVGQAINTAVIEFAAATGSWGTVSHFIFMSALTAGTMYLKAPLTAPLMVGAGAVVRFQPGLIVVTLS